MPDQLTLQEVLVRFDQMAELVSDYPEYLEALYRATELLTGMDSVEPILDVNQCADCGSVRDDSGRCACDAEEDFCRRCGTLLSYQDDPNVCRRCAETSRDGKFQVGDRVRVLVDVTRTMATNAIERDDSPLWCLKGTFGTVKKVDAIPWPRPEGTEYWPEIDFDRVQPGFSDSLYMNPEWLEVLE